MDNLIIPSPLSPPEAPPGVRDEPALRFMRMIVSGDALLTLTDAARVLHGRESENRHWIVENVDPVYAPSGKRLYRWADVVATLREEDSSYRGAA